MLAERFPRHPARLADVTFVARATTFSASRIARDRRVLARIPAARPRRRWISESLVRTSSSLTLLADRDGA
jgi:hypothetical protein